MAALIVLVGDQVNAAQNKRHGAGLAQYAAVGAQQQLQQHVLACHAVARHERRGAGQRINVRLGKA